MDQMLKRRGGASRMGHRRVGALEARPLLLKFVNSSGLLILARFPSIPPLPSFAREERKPENKEEKNKPLVFP